jgi:uncharacterized protein YkwD
MRFFFHLKLFLFFSTCPIATVSQTESSNIYANQVNAKYLEHLIKIKIDSVRHDNNLNALVNDSILYVAANYHANWMSTNKKFSHKESSNPAMLNPQDRVNHFGAVNYLVGENIIKSFVNTPLETKRSKTYFNRSYEDLANDFIDGWVHSPGHFKNIITPEYELTGLAISVDVDRNLVYAVQKFADVIGVYEFQENKAFFSYSEYVSPELTSSFDNISSERIYKKYPWKLKEPKTATDSSKRCTTCNENMDAREFKEYFKPKGRQMNLYSYNVKELENVIKRRRDGFALEYICYTPYDCGNPEYYEKPSRRNGQSILSDTVIKPLYRKDLKRGFKGSQYTKLFHIKKKGTSDHFDLNLGKMPKGVSGYYEVNILVIQKKRVCRVLHYSNYCGENIWNELAPQLLRHVPVDSITRAPSKANVEFEIPFEQGKYDYKLSDITKLLGAFSQVNFVADSIEIEAFSSLEGSDEINNNLQNKRAHSILNAIQDNQSDTIKSTVNAQPNWKLFDVQIESNSALSKLKGKSHTEIKAGLQNKDYAKSIEHYLAKQRYAKVTMSVTFELTDLQLSDTLLSDFNAISLRYAETLNSDAYDTLLIIHSMLNHRFLDGKASKHQMNQLQSMAGKNPDFKQNQYWFDLAKEGYDSLNLHQNYFKNWYTLPNRSMETTYNFVLLELARLPKYGFMKDRNPAFLEKDINQMTAYFDPSFHDKLDSLRLHSYIKLIHHFSPSGIGNDNDQKHFYCNKLVNKVKTQKYPEEDILKISKFMLQKDEDALAYDLLMHWATTRGLFLDESKTLLAKLGYYHNTEYHNSDYHRSLIKLYEALPNKTWCEMFIGPCNISFQVFDYELLHSFYCEKCGQYLNYAQDPEKWEK